MVNINFEVEDEDLHRAFKIKCINKGISMEEQINKLMKLFVGDEL